MTDLHLWLIPLVPLAGFLVNGLLGRKFSKPVVTAVALVASLIPLASGRSHCYKIQRPRPASH